MFPNNDTLYTAPALFPGLYRATLGKGEITIKKLFFIFIFISVIFASCSGGNTKPTTSPALSPTPQATNEVKWQIGPRFTNSDFGGSLYLGMEGEKVTEIFGKQNEDGWLTLYDNSVFILSVDGRVQYLWLLNNFSWETDEGFTKGTSKSDIRDFFGEPNSQRGANEKLNLDAMDTYVFEDDSGELYSMQLTYDTDSTLKSVAVFLDIPDDKQLGTVTFQESGTGDTTLDGVSGANIGVLDITHNGSGKFYVRAYDDKGNEKVMVDTQGKYSGQIAVPDFHPFSLVIAAEGEWTVVSRYSPLQQ